MTSALRLISGRGCWWALHGTRVARLPLAGVVPQSWSVQHDERRQHLHDRDRGRHLTVEAAAALEAGGFFRPYREDNYAVTVLTATACNLGCGYCFQNTAAADPGSSAPPRIRKAALDESLVDATLAFVERQQSATNLSTGSLLLFGGEPLLNVPACRRLLDGMRQLGLIDAEIVTNGVLLSPDIARDLHAAGLRRVQITFDGPRALHDQVRVTRNGGPTYEAILRNVRAAAAAVPQLAWNFRVNVSHHNVDGLVGLMEDLAQIARLDRQVTFHLALIDDTGLGYENNVGYDDEFAATVVAINSAAIRAGMRVPLSQPLGACPYCSAVGGTRGAVINADGGLYSCWENAGRDGWEVGHVHRGYVDRATVAQRWVACDFDIKSHAALDATRRFFDRVDAAALDDQYELRVLQRTQAS